MSLNFGSLSSRNKLNLNDGNDSNNNNNKNNDINAIASNNDDDDNGARTASISKLSFSSVVITNTDNVSSSLSSEEEG